MRLLWHHKHSNSRQFSEWVATLLRGSASPQTGKGRQRGAARDNRERKCQRKSQSVRGGARRKLYRIVVTLPWPRPHPAPPLHALFNGGSRQAADSAAFKINSIEIFFFPKTLKTSLVVQSLSLLPLSQAINDIAAFCLLFRWRKKNSLENCRKLFIFHFPFSFSFGV